MSVAEQLSALFDEIAPIGRTGQGGYRRFAFTPEDDQLRAFFRREVLRRGLSYQEDRAGNQWGWLGSRGPGAIVTGSHLDSVPDGGAFDGPLGVFSALVAIDELISSGEELIRPVAVVNFTEEEGGRFPLACRGSRLLTGVTTPEILDSLVDDAEVSFRTIRGEQDYTADPDQVALIGAFIELHIEQGRQLVTLPDTPLALATGIWPHGRWQITLSGTADHAGTTRLADRDDALLAGAELICAIRRAAQETTTLATVGKLEVTPGAINAVPSQVRLSLDARAPDQPSLELVVEKIAAVVAATGGQIEQISGTPATHFHPGLVQSLADKFELPLLATGAGHDAGILADAGVPATMLFVRNPAGVSHSPKEFAELSDCVQGVFALTRILRHLAMKPELP